jgi:hypothetical protein
MILCCPAPVAVTAVARELSAFIWAINRQIANPDAAAR